MEAMLKPSLIFDLILLAVLLVSAMASYRKGLLTAIVQFAGRLFSLAGAWFVSRKGSPYLFENFLERSFVTRVQSTISQQGAVDLTALVDKYAGFLPKSIQNSIIQSVSQTLDTGAPDVAQTIVTQVVEPLFTPIIAVVVFFIAFLSLIGLGIDKAIDLHRGIYGHLITDSPYFFIALIAMVLGSQFFLAGFLGDLISRQNPNRNDYQIEKEIRCKK